ncbi:hypothetical protein O0L34_g8652 [Tuta absoluta]|nr:hypothetical protein O0L34_g8652 [Tuta absoluta]
MVGKGDNGSSRIFHQCYLKCCKLQNLQALSALTPSGNGKVLDFCVDRIKYQDWPPIINALSCDLSLRSVSIRCRQQVKTVLEHIDCERLAKTVNKRAVILTNFMLSNLMEAISQMLSTTTLLTTILLEGLPLKIPYLNPFCEGLLANSSLQHIYLPRCLIGDAGCQAMCKAVRCLPSILTLDLSGCELTPVGAASIAEVVKYQKLHRYSENWVHTLRYRMPELDSMSGLRRITLCNNPQLGDQGVCKLLDVLADDLWIKALDVQNCGLTDNAASSAMQMLQLNTTLVVLDLRHNADVSTEWLSTIRAKLRENQRGLEDQYSWISSTGDFRTMKTAPSKNGIVSKDRMASNTRSTLNKSYVNKANVTKKEKDYAETLEDQLKEEILHRQQLEELNLQLVNQMKQLKQQQIQFWSNGCNGATSSGSEQSVQTSSRSRAPSSSSGCSSSIPIDQNTLSYIQQAFKDIYAFIKNNQCNGFHDSQLKESDKPQPIKEVVETESVESGEIRAINIGPKKAQSAHIKMLDIKMNKTTKSAHMLGDPQLRDSLESMKLEMIERQMGDSKNAHGDENNNLEELITAQTKSRKDSLYEKISPCSSVVSDSSSTLVCSSTLSLTVPNPREAFYSSTSDEDSD